MCLTFLFKQAITIEKRDSSHWISNCERKLDKNQKVSGGKFFLVRFIAACYHYCASREKAACISHINFHLQRNNTYYADVPTIPPLCRPAR